jgi:hypothetical protein
MTAQTVWHETLTPIVYPFNLNLNTFPIINVNNMSNSPLVLLPVLDATPERQNWMDRLSAPGIM